MKTCTKCKQNKSLNNFFKDKWKNDGHYTICRECKNTNRVRKKFEITNIQLVCCKKCKIEKTKDLFDRDIYHSTGLTPKCKECRKADGTKRYKKSSDQIKKVAYKYYYNNKEIVLKKQLEKQRKRLKTDIKYKLTRNLRNRLYYALKNKNWKKNTNFTKYIGCTRDELVAHLESQFKNNMSWDNYGDWHIDHKHPLDAAKTEEELYSLCHYTNLQPMWALDNIKKSNNVESNTVQISNKECKNT